MSDALHSFIQQHREAFDAGRPGAHGWKGLERMLERLPNADGLERQLMCDRLLFDTEAAPESVWAKIEQGLDEQAGGDALEGFIFRNREAFDAAQPSGQLWETIHGALPVTKAKVVTMTWQRPLMRMAASLLLLIAGIGAGIWYERHGSAPPAMAMSEVSDEYAELETYYQRDISGKQEKLATFTGNQSGDVNADLVDLDKAMEDLRRDLANVPAANREQVVRAMIENYKTKMNILQRVLEHLEESSNKGNSLKQSNEVKNI